MKKKGIFTTLLYKDVDNKITSKERLAPNLNLNLNI